MRPESVTARQPAGYKPGHFRMEKEPGSHQFEQLANPVSPEQLVEQLMLLEQPPGLHHSVALTGGEPLLHAPFLKAFLPLLKAAGLRSYLETSGDLFKPFAQVHDQLDYVAMDIKLPSVTGEDARWEAHEAFLQACWEDHAVVFAKTVVSADTDPAEIEQAARLIGNMSPDMIWYLQPMSAFGEADNPPLPAQLLAWQALARQYTPEVRVVPQCHKMMGQL